ncbi:MAG: hypothetical protein GY746_11610 [Gammaproteobacteria bacterium]|nr:hypothetical protein [Gammaproteobacteria bacterium]
MDTEEMVVFEFANAVLVKNNFGFWLRQDGEKPGMLIKAVCGHPTLDQAIEYASNILRNDKAVSSKDEW